MKYDDVTTNPVWRTAAILKIVFLAINRRFVARLTQNSITTSIIMCRYNHITKMSNFENSRWRTAASLKMLFFSLYLSRVSSDFNEIWFSDANFPSNSSHVVKYQNFANPIWRPAAILKIVFLGISQRFIVRLTRNLA